MRFLPVWGWRMGRGAMNQERRMAHFQEAYEFWVQRRLTQEEAAALLGVSDRTFRRWTERHPPKSVKPPRDELEKRL